MCCESNGGCNCNVQFISNPSIPGEQGPQGNSGTTVIAWSGILTASTATTGSDVLIWSNTTSVANSLSR